MRSSCNRSRWKKSRKVFFFFWKNRAPKWHFPN